MATCFSARSQRKPSEIPVSPISSGSGGPMLSISARVRIAVCDIGVSLFSKNRSYRTYRTYFLATRCGSTIVQGERECDAGVFRFHGSTYALVEIGQPSQRHRVIRIDLPRRFVVTNRVVFTSKPLEHLRHVEIAVQWTS